MEKVTRISTTRRRYNRVQYQAPVRYQVGREHGGHAVLRDVDQGGLSLHAQKAIPVGARLVLEVNSPRLHGAAAEFLGRVVWCKKNGEGYLVGVSIYHDEDEVLLALTELVCTGLKHAAGIRAMRDRQFRYVEWNCSCEPGKSQRLSVWRRFIPRGTWSPSHAATLSF